MARQQRIDLFGKFRPTGVDPTATARLQALGGVAQTVSQTAIGIAQKQAAKQGEAEGAQAQLRDEQGMLKSPDIGEDFTIRGQARNQAALTAYKAEVRRDSMNRINEFMLESGDDSVEFENKVKGYRAGILKNADPSIAPEIQNDLDNMIASASIRVRNNEFKRTQELVLASLIDEEQNLQDDILNAARSGDSDAIEDSLRVLDEIYQSGIEQGLISPSEIAERKEQMREQVVIQSKIGEIQDITSDQSLSFDEKMQRSQDLMKDIESDEFKDLSPNQKDSLANAIQVEMNGLVQQQTRQLAAQKKQMAVELSDLKVAAKQGIGDDAVILDKATRLAEKQLITESELTGIRNDVFNRQKKTVSVALSDAKVSRKLAGEEGIVLTQKEVDKYYEDNIAPAIDDFEPTERAAHLANMVERLKIVPKGLKNRIEQFALSGDEGLVLEAAAAMDAIDEIPGVADTFKPDQRAFLSQLNALAQNMNPERALEKARELTDPRNRDRIEVRVQEIKENNYKEDYSDIVKSELKSFFGAEMNEQSAAKASKEYGDLFEAHYKAGMSEDDAREKAMTLIKKNWGFSEAMSEYMKYPVDHYYNVSGDSRYIARQLLSEVNGAVFQAEPFKNDDVFLLSDDTTAKTATTGEPTYLIMVRSKGGGLEYLLDSDGDALRFKPDMQKEIKRKAKLNEQRLVEERAGARRKLPNLLDTPLGTL